MRWSRMTLVVLVALGLVCVPTVLAAGAKTERVSVTSSGKQGNAESGYSLAISANGRFVAFDSNASNLVPGDTNDQTDVFVHDRVTGDTERVSVRSSGAQAKGGSSDPSISADGRFVAFGSWAPNLVRGDTNQRDDVFVHDRSTGKTRRASVSSRGKQGKHWSFAPSISGNGRFVAFHSSAPNLVRRDTNERDDVFVRNLKAGKTERVSVTSSGKQGNDVSGGSNFPSMSADGRFIAFYSLAPNLVRSDTNMRGDVFVHDRKTDETRRVSISSRGQQGNGESVLPSISGTGRFVAFESSASNLVKGDSNGAYDVFVHDQGTRATQRVSVSSTGAQANSPSRTASISADGRVVALTSHASNLTTGDTNLRTDVFVHQMGTGKTQRVSVSSSGAQGNDHSGFYGSAVSADGRLVAFDSFASNLVGGDTNEADLLGHEVVGTGDVFVRGPLP